MTAKTVLKGFPLMVLQSYDGLYYNPQPGYGWVKDLADAKVYKRPGDAKCAMTTRAGQGWCSREDRNRCRSAKIVEIGSFSAKV